MKKSTLINSTIAGIITAGMMAGAAHAVPNQPKEWEKCAGISKKGMNHCGSLAGKYNCAGHATTDNADDSWIYVPKGTCARITGGIVAGVKPAKK